MTMKSAPPGGAQVTLDQLNAVALGLLAAMCETAAALCDDEAHRQSVASRIEKRVGVYPADFPYRKQIDGFLQAIVTHLRTTHGGPQPPRLKVVK